MKENLPYKKILDQRADPYVYLHSDNSYYFTASVPEYDRIELRKTPDIEKLDQAETRVVWEKHSSGPMSKHIWAPEIHLIQGNWYIYFAAGEVDDIWKIRPYVLKCNGPDPMTDSWSEMGIFQGTRGDDISFTDFSLDMTYFEHRGRPFVVWAQKDSGQFGKSDLYIAELETPCKLKTLPVRISRPELPWEIVGFYVNEGPAMIKNDGKIYLSYSASATDHHYCMGLLWADEASNLLDKASWNKKESPILQTNEEWNLFGPGHNSFTLDKEGKPIWVFHGRDYKEIKGEPLNDPNRHTLTAPVVWLEDGSPGFNF